jgi:site-specific DNA recombinase
MNPIMQKCAIYTRKSHEKGLEQEFNTLDAQREACLAYITSQKSEGWVPIKQHYDDGGYSGGTIERPALQQLIEDIKARKVNIVVVYKIDRLTRSLADFAKLVEAFDQYGVSFVSVTQSFNTTTSMGRLTLNVLLSFAQFEREVSGERIRDKIAASKKKGMWMGGYPPLGYDIKERQLILNEKEADVVRYIFDCYLDFKSIPRLLEHLAMKGIKSKSWVSANGREHTGYLYRQGSLHYLLSNPVYAGYTRHRKEIHEGMHEPIIPREKWQQVQNILITKSRTERGHRNQSLKYLLKGKIFDIDGVIYTPMRSNKGGKHYYYYVSQNLIQNKGSLKKVIGRLPAHEIEKLILTTVRAELTDIKKLSNILHLEIDQHYKFLEHISKRMETADLHNTLLKVTVDTDNLRIDICLEKLAIVINEDMNVSLPSNAATEIHSITVPYHTKRARRGAVMIQTGDKNDPLDLPKSKLEMLVRGIIWRDEHFRGRTFAEIAEENQCSRTYVIRVVNYSFLPLERL